MSQAASGSAEPSSLAPFAYPAFAVLWLATMLSNIGTWMHDVGAGWLMASLSPSPLWVALVQTATSLPIFLLALPAGALADIVDRRRMLLVVQTLLALVAAGLGIVVAAGHATPLVLLLFTFAMGMGAALTAPAWQAIVPSLVPKSVLQQAVASNSVGINISRAIGPALAGLVITAFGLAMPFLINAGSYLLVVAALLWWRPPARTQRRLPAEDLIGGMRSGLRYAWHSVPLKATLIRAAAFFLFASAYWATLPLLAKQVLAGGVELYGLLLTCVGLGAVGGAFCLPWLRSRLSADGVVAAGTLGTALSMACLAVIHQPAVAAGACALAGLSWIAVLSSLNVSAQVALPDWVRARGLSIFITVFFGAQTAGSMVWGQTASAWGIPAALLLAALGAVLMIPLTWRYKLHQGGQLNLAASMHWPEPVSGQEQRHDRGPVMITIEYRIDTRSAGEFVLVMDGLSRQRRRDGAYAWGLFEDIEQPGRYLEYFLVSSWLEHLRQHERVTHADQDIQQQARAFHVGDGPPRVSHLIAPERQ